MIEPANGLRIFYTSVQLAVFFPLSFLLFKRFHFKPLRQRSKLLTFLLLLFLNIHLSLLLIWSTYLDFLPCRILFALANSSALLSTHTFLFRILLLYMNHLLEKEAIKDNNGKEKWYVRFNFKKKKTIGYSAFLTLGLLVSYPLLVVFGIPIVKNNCFRAFTYIYCYFTVIIFLYAFAIIALGIIMVRSNNSPYIVLDIFGSTLAIFFIAFGGIFITYIDANPILADTLVFVSVMAVMLFSYIMPIVRTYFEEQKLLEQKGNMSGVERLRKYLMDRKMNEKMKKQLVREFSVENLMFYNAVIHYQCKYECFSLEEVQANVNYIFYRYIENGSNFEINISSLQYSRIKTSLKSYSKDIFKEAAEEILNLMSMNSLSSFEKEMFKEERIVTP